MVMRYDKRVDIVIEPEVSRYDPKQGKQVKTGGKTITVPCHLSPLSLERTVATFGVVNKSVYVFRCKGEHPKAERLRVGADEYKVIRTTKYRGRTIYHGEMIE